MEAKFTNQVKEIITKSRLEALRLGNDFILSEHLLLAMVKLDENIFENLKFKIDIAELIGKLDNIVLDNYPKKQIDPNANIPLTKAAEKVLKLCYLEVKALNASLINIEPIHLLLSILKSSENPGTLLLNTFGITYDGVLKKISEHEILKSEVKNYRLSKVAKEFNLSLGKITSFFKYKNIYIENNPNAKINDYQYSLIKAEIDDFIKLDRTWDSFLLVIKDNISDQNYKTWFETIRPIKLEKNVITVRVPSKFFVDWLEEYYNTIIKKALIKSLGDDAKINYEIIINDEKQSNDKLSIYVSWVYSNDSEDIRKLIDWFNSSNEISLIYNLPDESNGVSISSKIQTSNYFLALISKDSYLSSWMDFEIKEAKKQSKTIIVVYLSKEYVLPNELNQNRDKYVVLDYQKDAIINGINLLENKARNPRAKNVLNIEVPTAFSISENVDGVIGVKEQAKELAELLIDLKSETGMMVGLFGRWGRGKTFFWREIKKYLSNKDSTPFFTVDFHAWKYQDTPASWAYLYEVIAERITKDTDYYKIFGVKVVNKTVLALNLKKHGYSMLVWLLISFVTTVIWYFTISVTTKHDWFMKTFNWLSGFLTIGAFISFLIGSLKIYFKHIPKARDLFRLYSSIPSFKGLLGFQSEIQNELVMLLDTWCNKSNGQRILLFVDDIDRCSEERIIQIIDSLKVMLEDSSISQKIVVLAAIDERVLKRAIKHKYYDLLRRDFDKNMNDKENNLNTLAREYMDKLFISGVKLSALSTKEKEDVFDAFTKNRNRVNFKVEQDLNIGVDKAGTNINSNENKDIFYSEKKQNEHDINIISENLNFGNIDFEIEDFEYEFLKSSLGYFDEVTPRSIRIYYYRYLLAKRLLTHCIPSTSSLYLNWHNLEKQKTVLPELIIKYSKYSSPEEIIKYKQELFLNKDDIVELKLFDHNYLIDKILLVELINIVEMVVPY